MKTAERTAYYNDLSFNEKLWIFNNLKLGIERTVTLFGDLRRINPRVKLRTNGTKLLVFVHPDSIDKIQQLISDNQDRDIKKLLNEAFR